MIEEILADDDICLVLGWLDVRSLLKIRCVNRHFRKLTEYESIWKQLCRLDYSADHLLWNSWTFQQFYSEVLFPFAFLRGWWRRMTNIIGGLLYIELMNDGIHCFECLPPIDDRFYRSKTEYAGVRIFKCDQEDVPPVGSAQMIGDRRAGNNMVDQHKLRRRKIFSITSCQNRQLRINCFQDGINLTTNDCHRTCFLCETQISKHELTCPISTLAIGISSINNDVFRFSCLDDKTHATMDIAYWFRIEHGLLVRDPNSFLSMLHSLTMNEWYDIRKHKFAAHRGAAASFDATRFRSIPKSIAPTDDYMPLPGLYIGTYASHGYELINCHYELSIEHPDDVLFIGTKITGDHNVPADERTFSVNISKKLILNRDDLLSPEAMLVAIEHQAHQIDDVDAFRHQLLPFTDAPWNWDAGARVDISTDGTHCCGRYSGDGQIAAYGFASPSPSPIVLAVHSSGAFSLTWIKLRHISMMYRSDQQPSE